MHLSFSDEELTHELYTTDPLWLSLSQPVSSEWWLHHPAYICCIAVSLLELTSAAPVIIGRGVRFPNEVGSEMCNALIGRKGEISPPLPQHLWFQHGNMRDGAFNMYNHMSKLKLHACMRMLFMWRSLHYVLASNSRGLQYFTDAKHGTDSSREEWLVDLNLERIYFNWVFTFTFFH